MTLNLINLRENFILLATDKRTHSLDQDKISGVEVETVFCFDGDTKLFFFEPPHDFVAFCINGDDLVDVAKLKPDFESSLPSIRLTVKEYTERLIDFFSKEYNKVASIKGFPDMPLCFNVAGFNEDNSKHFYKFELPKKLVPEEVFHDVVEGSVEELKPLNELPLKLKKRLESKHKHSLNSIEKKLLNKILTGKSISSFTMKKDLIENAEFLIEYVSQLKIQNDAVQSVGGGADILLITPNEGIKKVKYKEADLVMSSAHPTQHFVSIKCCGNTSKIQIDDTKATQKGYLPFPSSNIFKCNICSTDIKLDGVKSRFIRRKEGVRFFV